MKSKRPNFPLLKSEKFRSIAQVLIFSQHSIARLLTQRGPPQRAIPSAVGPHQRRRNFSAGRVCRKNRLSQSFEKAPSAFSPQPPPLFKGGLVIIACRTTRIVANLWRIEHPAPPFRAGPLAGREKSTDPNKQIQSIRASTFPEKSREKISLSTAVSEK